MKPTRQESFLPFYSTYSRIADGLETGLRQAGAESPLVVHEELREVPLAGLHVRNLGLPEAVRAHLLDHDRHTLPPTLRGGQRY